mmetsp:Transcript_100911/g.291850  ORF Transcript_100911/g.291850 Transcript_100911/m.291850 type:complete len:337 (-) Transcript_100911:313-1323(-)
MTMLIANQPCVDWYWSEAVLPSKTTVQEHILAVLAKLLSDDASFRRLLVPTRLVVCGQCLDSPFAENLDRTLQPEVAIADVCSADVAAEQPAEAVREEHRVGVHLYGPIVSLVDAAFCHPLPNRQVHPRVEHLPGLGVHSGQQVGVDDVHCHAGCELDAGVAINIIVVAPEDACPLLKLPLQQIHLIASGHRQREAEEGPARCRTQRWCELLERRPLGRQAADKPNLLRSADWLGPLDPALARDAWESCVFHPDPSLAQRICPTHGATPTGCRDVVQRIAPGAVDLVVHILLHTAAHRVGRRRIRGRQAKCRQRTLLIHKLHCDIAAGGSSKQRLG